MFLEFKIMRTLPLICAALATGYLLPLQADDKPPSGSDKQRVGPADSSPHGERRNPSKSVEGRSGSTGQAASGAKSGSGVGKWPPGKLRPVQEY